MENEKERILFIRRPGAFGGIEVLLLDWLSRIDYGKHEVVVASTKDFFSDPLRKSGIPATCRSLALPVLGGFLDIFRNWARDIRDISPDKIVLMQGKIDELPLPCLLAAYKASPGNVYMTEHLAAPTPPEKERSVHFGFVPGIGWWWYKHMLTLRARSHLARRILAVSEGVRRVLLMYGYPPEKISIAYHGVDVSQFSPSEEKKIHLRQWLGIPERDVVFISTARLAREKRVDRIIRAVGALSRVHGPLWLLIAGEGPMRKELEALKSSLECGERIKLLGLVDNVSELLQASDVFVLSSDREGLSVSLTEAMSAGLVCIASDVSGSNEVIRDGENGVLVEPSDRGVLQGMERVLTLNEHSRQAIGQNARRLILERFEKGRSVRNILGLLDIACV